MTAPTGRDERPAPTGRDERPAPTGRDERPAPTGRDERPAPTGRDERYVHPTAIVGDATIGPRTRIHAFVHVLDGAVIGADCKIGDHCFIDDGAIIADRVTVKNGAMVWDGVTIEDEVFIGPRVTFTNDLHPRIGFPVPAGAFVPTRVRRGASIGAGATIVCGVTIGERATVGAGAVVTRDVAPHTLVAGNPARRIGWACRCGAPLRDGACAACGRAYRVDGTGDLVELIGAQATTTR